MKKMATYTVEQNERDSHALFDMVHSIRNCPCPGILLKINLGWY